MKHYYIQETDSRMVYALPPEVHYRFMPVDETIGRNVPGKYIPLPMESNVLDSAWESTRGMQNKIVAQETMRVLAALQDTLFTFRKFNIDLSYIPQLQVSIGEDESVLLEWVFSDYRVGFNLEPNLQDSGWFLITNRKLGEITASGFISNNDLSIIILWLLNFIISHA